MTEVEKTYYEDCAKKIERNRSKEPFVITYRLWSLVRSFEEQPARYKPT